MCLLCDAWCVSNFVCCVLFLVCSGLRAGCWLSVVWGAGCRLLVVVCFAFLLVVVILCVLLCFACYLHLCVVWFCCVFIGECGLLLVGCWLLCVD